MSDPLNKKLKEAKRVVNKITTRSELRKEMPSLHRWAWNNGVLEELCENMPTHHEGVCENCGNIYSHPWEDKGAHLSIFCKSCKTSDKYEQERRYNKHLKREYGTTLRDVRKALQIQGSSCQICKTRICVGTLHVDHCHKSEQIRGLLCRKCNLLLGHADDQVDTLSKAAEYIKEQKMIWYTIYTQSGKKCPYCDKAAELLEKEGAAFHMRPLIKTQLLEQADRANMNTVPIIYHGVRLIGGYDDLVKYMAEQE